MHSENCSLLGPDDVHGQISEHTSKPNRGYFLYLPEFGCLIHDVLSNHQCERFLTDHSYHVWPEVFQPYQSIILRSFC